MLVLIVTIALAFACGLTACNTTATITQVEVVEMPTQSTYYVGDVLDVSGCVLGITYSNRDVKLVDVTPDMVSAVDMTSIGSKVALVTYEEKGVRYTTTMVIRVTSRPASSLRILTMPTKTEYVEGESIDLTGLTVEAYYSEEQRATLGLNDLSYTATTATAGMTEVRVGFAKLTLAVPITVHPVAIVGIEAALREGETVYRNQVLTISLLDVQYVYNNDTRRPIADATLQEEGQRAQGALTLHVTSQSTEHGDYACTLAVEAQPDTVRSVALAEAPLQYQVGAAFRWQDIYVDITFAHSVATHYRMGVDTYAGLTLSMADGTAMQDGLHVVEVCLNDTVLTTFRVGVGAAVPVRWRVAEGADEVITCRVGEVPTPYLLQLYAVMSDGTEVQVWRRFAAPDGVSVTLPDPAVLGQTQASLVYEGMVYTYAITVSE